MADLTLVMTILRLREKQLNSQKADIVRLNIKSKFQLAFGMLETHFKFKVTGRLIVKILKNIHCANCPQKICAVDSILSDKIDCQKEILLEAN